MHLIRQKIAAAFAAAGGQGPKRRCLELAAQVHIKAAASFWINANVGSSTC